MTIWHVVADGDLPSLHQENLYDPWSSKPVLALTRWGTMLVCVLEQWEDTPEWFDNSRDHWNMDDTITHWTELPEPPNK